MNANHLPLEAPIMRSFVYRAPSCLPHPWRRATDPFFSETPVEVLLYDRDVVRPAIASRSGTRTVELFF